MSVGAGYEGDPDLAVDRCGQDVTQVEIGVLADQVHPPGGAHELDRGSPPGGLRLGLAECLGELGRLDRVSRGRRAALLR